MRFPSPRLSFLSAVLGLALAPMAQAIPATVNFTAELIGSSNGLFPLGTGSGFLASGSFTYEDSIADSEADLTIGRYVNALTGFTLNLPLLAIANDGPANIAIRNDNEPSSGHFQDRIIMAFSVADTTPGGGFFPQAVVIDFGTLGSSPSNLLTSTALPAAGAAWPNPAAFNGNLGGGAFPPVDMTITFGHSGGSVPIVGFNFVSFTPVQPPPAAGVPDTASVAGLLAVALGAMAAGARRLRRA